ncbi:MAG: coproporphyrinogen dehydrogenase HemZ [Oscillospiraceae bacterium]|nr:coproporphyrinogen dehydrogenase HemZ [Oscillospiraceae bacterium]
MEIFLVGHDYKYAAEQSLLVLYPEERPVYPAEPSGGNRVTLTLTRGNVYAVCVCELLYGGVRSRGESRTALAALTDPVLEDRFLQRCVKQAFFKAAVNGGHSVPDWGSLTGVRPGKLFLSLLNEGKSEKQAVRHFRREFGVSAARTELVRCTTRATLRARESLESEDVCLYLGIPFCPTRCAYCSFVSIEASRSLKLLPEYLAAQERELEAVARAVEESGRRIAAVYIGGGTPTTLSAAQLDRLCRRTRELFDLSHSREFTVEAGRPDTVTEEKLCALRDNGVTRVSVNPQTMSDSVLAAIGRRHSVEDIYRSMELVQAMGCFQVNMDLIAGLPGDSPEQFAESVRKLIAFRPENITVHTLALKKGSRLTLEGTALPDGEAVRQMLDAANALLSADGFAPYYLYRQKFMSGSFENVGWTKPGAENLYNICIMEELCGILSVGAGGSTKLVKEGTVARLMAPKYPREYIDRMDSVCAAKEKITAFYR